jgi:hypothetical protein
LNTIAQIEAPGWLIPPSHRYQKGHTAQMSCISPSYIRQDHKKAQTTKKELGYPTHLIFLRPSKSPPVCISVPSGMNCPDEHHGSVCRKRGRTVLVPGSKSTECAVQSCGRTKSSLSLQTPAAEPHYHQALGRRKCAWWVQPYGTGNSTKHNDGPM